jgi:hypothetical protein
MTTAMSRVNGRPRSTLAGQIDRLDEILDGLSEALTQAVADAVKEAVTTAVAELARRPELLQPVTEAKSSPATRNWRDRLRRIAGRAAALVHDALARVAQRIHGLAAWVRATAGRIGGQAGSAGGRMVMVPIATVARYRIGIEDFWQRHRPVVLAVAVVFLAGVAWALVGPFAACLACGGLALALAFGTLDGLIGRHRPGGQWSESPGDCVQQLSVAGQEYWI